VARNRKSRYIALAKQTARKHNIPWPLFASMIDHESGWNPAAVSDAGAIGLGQLMPGTARGMGIDPWDPKQNLEGAARYLSGQFSKTQSWKEALRAYNYGPAGAAENPHNGLEYANSVLAGRSQYRIGSPAPKKNGYFTAEGWNPPPPMSLGQLAEGLFGANDPFTQQFQQLPGVLGGMGPTNGVQPDQIIPPPGHKGAAWNGDVLVLPTGWQGSHITDGLNWNGGKGTAKDIMAHAGTPVGAPESGTVVYWHADGAQSGGSILFRADSGALYWLGHLDDGIAGGTHVNRGQVIAAVSSRHAKPHVHIDRYYGKNPGRYIK